MDTNYLISIRVNRTDAVKISELRFNRQIPSEFVVLNETVLRRWTVCGVLYCSAVQSDRSNMLHVRTHTFQLSSNFFKFCSIQRNRTATLNCQLPV